MPLTNQDYRIVITGEVLGITCKNVFWYKADSSSGIAANLAEAFTSTIVPEICNVQQVGFTWTNIDVYNLVTPTNFYVGTLSDVGTRTGGAMPPFNTWYIRYFRPSTEVANGRKAIAGLSESDVLDGEIVVALAAVMDTLTDYLEAPITDIADIAYTPCIAKTEPYTNPETGKTYRVPVDLYTVNRVEYVKVSSQNSRKR